VRNPLAIQSKRIVTPEGVIDGLLVIRDGLVDAVVPAKDAGLSAGGATHPVIGDASTGVLDVGDQVILPGLVDTHVHINEPGHTDWEGFETATMAAASGGVTTLVDMPLNSLPVTTTASALQLKLDAAAGKLHVDCGFYGGVVPGGAAELPDLMEAGVLGLKAFMVDSGLPEFPASGLREVSDALAALASHGAPLLVHAELAGPSPVSDDPRSYPQFAAGRPQSWEEAAVELLIKLCQEHGTPIHIVHLAAAACLPAIRRARAVGLPLTVETCPHYLYFESNSIPDGSTLHKCAPPIRDARNRELLREALCGGDIDFVATDHSPSLPEMKHLATGNLDLSWGGISSLGLSLSIMWSVFRTRPAALESLAHWLSGAPAALVGLTDRGAIVPGKRADLVVWNPEYCGVLSADALHFHHQLSPYVGETLWGQVSKTFLAGACVFESDPSNHAHFLDLPRGKTILRNA
jgi:allantoinase